MLHTLVIPVRAKRWEHLAREVGVRHPTSAETLVICGQLHLRNDILNFF